MTRPSVAGSATALATTPEGVRVIADALTGWIGEVGLDTETTGLDPTTDRVRLIQLAVSEDTALIDVFALPNPRQDLAPLFAALADKEVIGHNLQFDLRFLGGLGFVPGVVYDTMLASRVLHAGAFEEGNARMRHGLREAAERELGRVIDKTEQRSDWSGRLTPEQLEYTATDAALLLPLAGAFKKSIERPGLAPSAATEMRALLGVSWAVPVAVDVPAWLAIASGAETERAELAARMDAVSPNPTGLPGMEARN